MPSSQDVTINPCDTLLETLKLTKEKSKIDYFSHADKNKNLQVKTLRQLKKFTPILPVYCIAHTYCTVSIGAKCFMNMP